uniref:Uncharacterized protein n=1 Tax=Moniliophthora roreri TaxID=221103 RepID=A0A0W0EZZ8_MONRR
MTILSFQLRLKILYFHATPHGSFLLRLLSSALWTHNMLPYLL